MKRLGLLGGMSWESSIEYERIINEEVHKKLGGVSSADLIIRSFNFAEIEKLQANGEWRLAGEILSNAARDLQNAGAEAILICTNTMHLLADVVESRISVPLIHIADATAKKIQEKDIRKVGLLGTRYTMTQDFYKGRLVENFGLEVIIPNELGITKIHDIIYKELVLGKVNPESKHECLQVCDELIERGAKGIISGCTEIELLIGQHDLKVPFFPTARLHALAGVEFSLG